MNDAEAQLGTRLAMAALIRAAPALRLHGALWEVVGPG